MKMDKFNTMEIFLKVSIQEKVSLFKYFVIFLIFKIIIRDFVSTKWDCEMQREFQRRKF